MKIVDNFPHSVNIDASNFVGATSQDAGAAGLVPAPSAGDQDKVLKGDGTWDGLDKSDVGLNNVGNFKAVSTVASQGLTDTEKSNARANIGAGTSSFSGSYNDLTNKPEHLGHTIEDENGTSFTQRSTLKIVGATITDDSANDATVVEVEGGGTTIVQKPTVSVGTYTYNGTAQGPAITWNPASMADYCDITNATKTDAGTYTLTIALKNTAKMVWDDFTTADLTYSYTINKATASITTNKNSITLNSTTLTDTFTYSVTGDGTVTVSSSNTSVATVSGNSSPVTVSSVNEKSGTATVTISMAAGNNYNSTSKTVSVTCDFLAIVTFADGTDEQIKAMLDAYYANDITWAEMGWAVGDTRKIHLNAMTAPNPNSSSTWAAQDITVVIVAHDHTDLATAVNGHTKSCITVQCREVLNNNTSGYNQAGHIYVNGDSSYDMTFTKWSNLYIRTYMNSTVLGAIPSGDFKSAIRQSKHYRHTNYNTADDEQVTDTLFLPSYPEIYGTASYNYYVATTHTEGTQFAYYADSSKRVKYGNNNGASNGTAQYWWEGSASSYYSSSGGYDWCDVYTTGSALDSSGNYASGLAPAFAM